jgi:cob(I)alamin adenosyltransferase
MDELNSMIGLLISYADNKDLIEVLQDIQNHIFELSAELAAFPEKNMKLDASAITIKTIKDLENNIDIIESQLEPLKSFILPGGSRTAAICHLARTVCRRAEREIITLNSVEEVSDDIMTYVNRLSDYFFVLARHLNKQNNTDDIPWISG